MSLRRILVSRRIMLILLLISGAVVLKGLLGITSLRDRHSVTISARNSEANMVNDVLKELTERKQSCGDRNSEACVSFNYLMDKLKSQLINSNGTASVSDEESDTEGVRNGVIHMLERDDMENGKAHDPHEHVIRRLGQAQRTFRLRSDNNETVFQGGSDAGLSKECLARNYGDLSGWPRASVIIPFCENEQLVDVLHTVHSIVQRSPDRLLEEVILIDDNTQKADFKELFENYCQSMFGGKVRIYRSNVTLGLIQGRLLGTRLAKGDVIVTMDAHMEVQETWLHALIWEIKQNRKTMATAQLDWMKPSKTGGWLYEKGINSFMCVFSWDLGFGFAYPRPEIDKMRRFNQTRSYPAPCSVGTIWAMNRKFFKEIGELDDKMELWGGENLDLPIRTWLFGGQAVQVPCSHAAHLERPHQRDYRYGWDNSIKKNYKRVVEVWFDEFKENAYMEKPELRDISPGDLTERFELKKRAVHNFAWFLSNVYPEIGLFNNYTFGYEWVKNLGLNKCFHRAGDLILWDCLGQPWKENFWLTVDGYLRTSIQYWTAQSSGRKYRLGPEGSTGTFQQPHLSKWIHWKGGPLMLYDPQDEKRISKNLCIQAVDASPDDVISIAPCDPHNKAQRWEFKTYSNDYMDFMAKGPVAPYDTEYHEMLFKIKEEWTDKNT